MARQLQGSAGNYPGARSGYAEEREGRICSEMLFEGECNLLVTSALLLDPFGSSRNYSLSVVSTVLHRPNGKSCCCSSLAEVMWLPANVPVGPGSRSREEVKRRG